MINVIVKWQGKLCWRGFLFVSFIAFLTHACNKVHWYYCKSQKVGEQIVNFS